MPGINIERLFRLHCLLIGAITLAHLVSRTLFFIRGNETSLTNVFNFQEESSVPTVASTAGLLAASLAAFLIAQHALTSRQAKSDRWGDDWSWAFISACFLFLAIDEGAALHDRLTFPLQSLFGFEGIFYIGWVVPYIALVIVAGLLCLPLAFRLPRATLLRIVVAGVIFVGAALGLELVESALIHSIAGEGVALRDADLEAINRTPLMMLLITLEEFGEMLAIALLLRAFLLHLVQDRGITTLRLAT